MKDAFDFEPTKEQKLYLVAGVIALEYQKIFRAFDVGGFLPTSPENREFERRRKNWTLLVRRAFSGDTKSLDWHNKVNNRIGRLKDMRDSILHGNPSFAPFEEIDRIFFTMEYPEKRFRQRAVAHHLWKQRKLGREKSLESAKWWSENEHSIQFSYTLDELVRGARDIPNLHNEVMSITFHAKDLVRAGWLEQESAQPHHTPTQ